MAFASITYTSASGTTFPLTNDDGNAIEYLRQDDISVTVNGVLQTITTDYTFNSAGTAIVLNSAVSNATVLLARTTSIADATVSFTPGSTLTAQDLNNSDKQNRFGLQEFTDIYDDLRTGTGDLGNLGGFIDSQETWLSDDAHAATTGAIDLRVAATIDTAITNDIGTDGTGITVTDDGDGTITLGLAASGIDLDRINADDIVTQSEQNASPDNARTDNEIFTGLAATTRFDTIVNTASQTGTDYPIGKTWLKNDASKTVSIWNGSAWVPVASGGSFTELTQVIYVDPVNGDDNLDGHRISNPKRTIKAALADVDSQADGAGTTISLSPGVYQEELPLTITKENVSIVGSALRSCFVQPKLQGSDATGYNVNNPTASETATMFLCDSGTLLANMTFVGIKASGNSNNTVTRDTNGRITTAADRSQTLDPGDVNGEYGLPRNQGWVAAFRSNSVIKKSPYIQNCTVFADAAFDNSVEYDVNNLPDTGLGGDTSSACTGGGILCDGSTPAANSPLRSFVVDSFTQVNLDGPGILCTNNGYTQLVSFFGTFCHYHAKSLKGGQLNLSNCTTDFGRYGLIADGKSATNIFTASSSGTANAGATSFTIGATTPDASWHGDQTNPRPLDNMLVQIGGNADGTGGTIYPILSSTVNGGGYDVEISNPDPVDYSSNLGLAAQLNPGTTIRFFLRSLISTSGHTFEYCGSGTNYSGHPDNGGVAVIANQVKNLNDGKVWQSSTDENGRFQVGETFTVDQKTGAVTIPASASPSVTKTGPTKSAVIPAGTTAQRDTTGLVAGLFRFNTTDGAFEGYNGTTWTGIGGGGAISPLTADLDVGGFDIISTSNGNIDFTANGTGLIRVTENNLSQVPIVTQHDIGTAANEIPLNQYLGTAAFQDSSNFSVGDLQIATAYTVATLPSSPSVGRVARVTDANSPSVGATVAGSGAAAALCWYNGTNWTVIGV